MQANSDPGRIALIDIGSNSIKLLVAERGLNGAIKVIEEGIEETRISAGISRTVPRLQDAGMDAAIESIEKLRQSALRARAGRLFVVATSAVRDAANSQEFARRLHKITGLELRILTGLEEAEWIAAGVRTDPELSSLGNFYLFDLGGGSLETLAIQGDSILCLDSLPLGCVRLTEQFVTDPEATFPDSERRAIEDRIEQVLDQSSFAFDLPPADGAKLVFTGGTASVALFLGDPDADEPSGPLTQNGLEHHLEFLSALPIAERSIYPGLPAARADVFPAALTTLLTLMRLGGFTTARHSFRNLRYGLAARLLASG